MTKEEFLLHLEKELKGTGVSQVTTYSDYYREMITDYMEDGYSEGEAIEKIGSIDSIVTTIKEELGIEEKPSVKKSPLIWFLLIIGAPLWGSILISIILLLLSGVLILWCAPFILGSLSFAGLITGIVSLMGLVFNTSLFYIMTQLGIGLIALGIGFLLLIGTIYLTKSVGMLSRKLVSVLQSLFSLKGWF